MSSVDLVEIGKERHSKCVREDWEEFNLNFDELSKRLIVVKREFRLKKAVSSRSLTGETRTFAEILDQEVEKIVLFYLRQQGDIAKRVWMMRQRQITNLQGCPVTIEEIDSLCRRYRELSEEVLDLLEYLDLNVISLRKILRKHDKQFDLKMTSLYFDQRLGNAAQNSQLVQLYHQEGIRAIIGTIRRGFEDLYEAKGALCSIGASAESPLPTVKLTVGPSTGMSDLRESLPKKTQVPRVPYMSRVLSFSSLHLASREANTTWLGSSNMPPVDITGSQAGRSMSGGLFSMSEMHESIPLNVKQAKTNTGKAPNRSLSVPMFSALLEDKPLKPLERSVSDLEPVLKQISEVADRVMRRQKKTTVDYIASHSSMAIEMRVRDLKREEELDDDDDDDLKDSKKTSSMGLFLNLFITFLYMANQYVVAPTSGKYADKLGMSPAVSGAIIGMTPFAAFFSALVFSAWSNYSFKKPLLTSLVFLTMGNLLYAAALQCDSTTMVFAGRMLSGLGGPRGITRRYIADHVSLEDRTIASSHFVTAGALGLAFGPLISSLMSITAYQFKVELGVLVVIQYEEVTAPGWIMSALFFACFLMTYFLFEDPLLELSKDQRHIKRQPSIFGLIFGPSQTYHLSSDIDGPISSNYQVVVGVETLDFAEETAVPVTRGPGSRTVSRDRLADNVQVIQDTGASSPAGGIKVEFLIIDDTPANCTFLIRALMPKGIKSELAEDGLQGLKCVQQETGRFQVVFVDFAVPVISGVRVTRQIREAGFRNLIVGLLSKSLTEDADAFLAAGADLVLTKPLRQQHVDALVHYTQSQGIISDASSWKLYFDNDGLGDAAIKRVPREPRQQVVLSSKSLALASKSDDHQPHYYQHQDDVKPNGNGYLYPPQRSSMEFYEAMRVDQKTGTGGPRAMGGMNGGPSSWGSSPLEIEQQYLLESESSSCCWNHISIEVAIILFIYIVNKIGQEIVVSAVPTLCRAMFGWGASADGFFMATMGFLVLPASVIVSLLAKDIDDRTIMTYSSYLCLGSIIILANTSVIPYSVFQYLLGSVLLFSFLNAHEGVIMSLLSKLVSPELAKGTFNSGLLSTQAGTLGRIVGDAAITGFGVMAEPKALVNLLFLPIGGGLIVCMLITSVYYEKFEV